MILLLKRTLKRDCIRSVEVVEVVRSNSQLRSKARRDGRRVEGRTLGRLGERYTGLSNRRWQKRRENCKGRYRSILQSSSPPGPELLMWTSLLLLHSFSHSRCQLVFYQAPVTCPCLCLCGKGVSCVGGPGSKRWCLYRCKTARLNAFSSNRDAGRTAILGSMKGKMRNKE